MNPILAKVLPYLLGAAAIVIAVLWFGDHERSVEKEKIAAQNYQQLADAKAKADAETKRLQGVADAADKSAQLAQADFDAYRAAHPVGHVWVCPQPSGGQHSPSGVAETNGGHAGSSAGPEAGATVLAGGQSEASDIGPELDLIVSSFAKLAVELSRWQHQPVAQ